MNIPNSSPPRARTSWLNVRPAVVRVVSALALVSLHVWFLLKLLLVEPSGLLETAVGLCSLVGLLSTVFVFFTRYTVQAHAGRRELDERELIQRNEAYYRTYQYLLAMVLFGLVVREFWERVTGLSLSPDQWYNFLTVMFFSGMILPATVLAWQDRSESDSDDD